MNQNLTLQIKSWLKSNNKDSFANFLTGKKNLSQARDNISFLSGHTDYIWEVIQKCSQIIDNKHLNFGHRDAYKEKIEILSFFLGQNLIDADTKLVEYVITQITSKHTRLNAIDKNELYGRARSSSNISLYRELLKKSSLDDWKRLNNINGIELFDIYDLDNIFNILSKLDVKDIIKDKEWISDIRNNIKDKLVFECKLINTRRLHLLPELFNYKPLELSITYIALIDRLTFQFCKTSDINAIDAYLLNKLYKFNFELKNQLPENDISKLNNLLFMYADNFISKDRLIDELKVFYNEPNELNKIEFSYE